MVQFSDLVREAFIDPLRSVLIVDDQYPTWEEILNTRINGVGKNEVLDERSKGKKWTTLPTEPLDVIREFRSRKPGFVIDIHDALAPKSIETAAGTDPPETPSALADHLHQSDLLVLDYNLEGKADGLRGQKAKEILRKVLSNNHFNLIIVHTGEDNLDDVMAECLIALLQSCTPQFEDSVLESLASLDERINELVDEEKFDPKRLQEFFSIGEYLEVRRNENSNGIAVAEFMRGEGQLAKLYAWGKEINLKGGQLKSFLFWAIREFEKTKLNEFSQKPLDGISWRQDTDCKWLRSSRGFVAFVEKGPANLLGELQKALENWKPTPSRLLSAKYRHALNRIGVEAEDKSLANSHVFAQFYDSIVEPARADVPPAQATLSTQFKFKEHVSRQTEAISFLIEDELVGFGEKILRADQDGSNGFATHYGINLGDEKTKRAAVEQFNSYVSTLPRKTGNDQLDSGHVFKLDNEWWVCATPACDLQPGQNTIAFSGSSSDLRPFTAIQLVVMKSADLKNDHINSGSCCFVQEDSTGKVVCLGLRSISEESKPGTQKVTWRTFLAKEQGLIKDGNCKIIQPKLTDTKLDQDEVDGTVVAKLRYEYALNYIQRVGASVSRVGLGYAAYPPKD